MGLGGSVKGAVMGAIIDVVVLAVSVQAGWISPAKSLQENIIVAIFLVAGKWIVKRLFF